VQLDRRQYAHFLRMGTFARAPLAGGAPRPVRDNVMWMDWSPVSDEYAIVVRGDDDIDRLEYPAGHTLVETTDWIGQLRISPDGEHVAFCGHPLGRYDDGGGVAVVDRAGNVRVLTDSYWSVEGVAWSPAGDEIWYCGGQLPRVLKAVDLDGNVRQIAGTFTDITLRDIDGSGRVLVSEDRTRRGISLIDPKTGAERDLSWLDQSSGCDVSADGRWLLSTEEGSQNATSIAVIRKTDGSLPVVLGEGFAFALSPDASEVLVGLNEPTRLAILPTGAGAPRILDLDVVPTIGGAWAANGHDVIFAGFDADNQQRLFVHDLDTDSTRAISPPGVASNGLYYRLVVSPDSKQVAAIDRADAVWICNLSGDAPTRIHGVEAGELPVEWSADGQWLYVGRMRSNRVKVYRVNLKTGARELWREIVPADPAGMEIYGVLMTPDATTLGYTYKRLTSDLYVVDGWR
jgi:WD40 repeat protein